jgi:hypothetical protein
LAQHHSAQRRTGTGGERKAGRRVVAVEGVAALVPTGPAMRAQAGETPGRKLSHDFVPDDFGAEQLQTIRPSRAFVDIPT